MLSPSRPVAGYANLCPSMISSEPQEFEGMLATVKHEVIHALVSPFPAPPSPHLLLLYSSELWIFLLLLLHTV